MVSCSIQLVLAILVAPIVLAHRTLFSSHSSSRSTRIVTVQARIDGKEGTYSEALQLLSRTRRETNGNGLKFDGSTSDSSENKKVWKKYAPLILDLLPPANICARDSVLCQAYTEAVMYSTSSKGVIRGITSGKSFAFLNAVKTLMTKYPTQDNGVAYIFDGAYHIAAPWPLRSYKKALLSFEKALEIEPNSRRNIYYCGVAHFVLGNKEKARELFERSAASSCMSASEEDINEFLLSEAKNGISFLSS